MPIHMLTYKLTTIYQIDVIALAAHAMYEITSGITLYMCTSCSRPLIGVYMLINLKMSWLVRKWEGRQERGWDSSISLCNALQGILKLRTSFGSKKRARVMTATILNKKHLFII